MKRSRFGVAALSLLAMAWALCLTPAAAFAEFPMETASVASLPPAGDHWVWVPDRLLQHSILFDGETGEALGMIDSSASLTPRPPVRAGGFFYSADIAYSRGLRGDRIDFVSIYDARTLAYVDEIVFPTMQGQSNASLFYAELIGERFLGIFNQFPTVSVSIIDLEERRFAEEIVIAGCAAIYPVDDSHFATLCGDGTAALVGLDEDGHKASLTPSEPFFDPVEDPVFIAAGRDGASWTFVTFGGNATRVDFSGGQPKVGETWPLATELERAQGWRPGGLQHVALHAASQRLFVVMHEGESGSHKQAGPEIWAFDLEARERVARFEVPNLTAAFLADQMGIEEGSFTETALHWVVPSEGAHSLVVTSDDAPLLFIRNAMGGAVAVLDANSGKTLRFLSETGLTGPTLRVP